MSITKLKLLQLDPTGRFLGVAPVAPGVPGHADPVLVRRCLEELQRVVGR